MNARFVLGIAFAGAAAVACTRTHRAPEIEPSTLTLTLAGAPRGPGASGPASGEKIRSLDPARAEGPSSADQAALAYETLYAYHYLRRPYVLVPELAAAMPAVQKDGRTVVISLRKGILFQDDRCFAETGGRGRELTADDVIYTLRRLADPRTGAQRAWAQLDGWIDGLAEWRIDLARASRGKASSEAGETGETGEIGGPGATGGNTGEGGAGANPAAPIGLRALDRYRIEIRLVSAAWVPALPELLSRTFTAVVPHEAVEAYGGELGSHPVGTGPFQLSKLNASGRLIWQRNPTFRRETYPDDGEPGDRAAGFLADAGRALPMVDQLIVVADDDPAHAWSALLAGEVDLAPVPDAPPGPAGEEASAPTRALEASLRARDLEMRAFPRVETGYLAFNRKDPFLARTRALRVAIHLALGAGQVPPQINGDLPPRPNPAQARELLAMAGYPGGMELPPLELAFDSANAADREAAEFLRARLEAVGIRLHLRELSGDELDAEMKLGKIPLWAGAWGGNPDVSEYALGLPSLPEPTPSPSSALSAPASAPVGEDAVAAGHELDRLLVALGSGPLAYADRVRLALDQADDRYLIFGFNRTERVAFRKRLVDFKPHELGEGMARYYRADLRR